MKQHVSIRLSSAGILVFFSIVPSLAWAQSTQPSQPAPAVVVERVEVGPASPRQRFNGQVEAVQAVNIQARVTGFLKSVMFDEGQAVRAGDRLFEIEPDQMRAAAASANAQVARAEASQNSARQSLARARDLYARRTVARSSLDDAQAAFDVASADVEIAKAALNDANLNLSYTEIRSPINGNIGRSLFTIGNLVGPNAGPLARIVQLDPVRVAFSLTDSVLVGIRQKQAGGATIDPNALKLTLTLANGTEYGERGTVQFLDNEVSSQTGTIAVRALFPNSNHILVPGQFVTLNVLDEGMSERPLVPVAAVLQDRLGKYVFVLNEDKTVSRRTIVTGARIDNRWTVTEGLKGGETIVVQGLQRVSDGQRVTPDQSEIIQ